MGNFVRAVTGMKLCVVTTVEIAEGKAIDLPVYPMEDVMQGNDSIEIVRKGDMDFVIMEDSGEVFRLEEQLEYDLLDIDKSSCLTEEYTGYDPDYECVVEQDGKSYQHDYLFDCNYNACGVSTSELIDE